MTRGERPQTCEMRRCHRRLEISSSDNSTTTRINVEDKYVDVERLDSFTQSQKMHQVASSSISIGQM